MKRDPVFFVADLLCGALVSTMGEERVQELLGSDYYAQLIQKEREYLFRRKAHAQLTGRH